MKDQLLKKKILFQWEIFGHERRITNVADPVRGTDAANKQYVDRSVGAVRSEMKKTDKKLRGGIAGATAAANIHK